MSATWFCQVCEESDGRRAPGKEYHLGHGVVAVFCARHHNSWLAYQREQRLRQRKSRRRLIVVGAVLVGSGIAWLIGRLLGVL